jgi:hypothetical protein
MKKKLLWAVGVSALAAVPSRVPHIRALCECVGVSTAALVRTPTPA